MEESSPQEIPAQLYPMEILHLVHTGTIGAAHVLQFQQQSGWNNRSLADCLGISVKKLRTWQRKEKTIPEKEQEHLVVLISLFKQGEEVFESDADFRRWLEIKNFHFGGEQPFTYLKTIYGIKFVSDRLTGMAYGDNA